MSASPNEQEATKRDEPLSLVPPLVKLTPLETKKFGEDTIAQRLGVLTTYANEHHRDFLAGKSGIGWEVERRNARRVFATYLFQEFGMLEEGAILPEEELAALRAKQKTRQQQKKKDGDNGPTALDALSDAGQAFVNLYYDPAEKVVEHTPRSELAELIEKRFDHPVIRTVNAWARTGGEHDVNAYIREDAVMVQRAAAIILERIADPAYVEENLSQ